MVNVSIIGGSGYAGGELVRLLLDHPEVTAPIVGADRPEYVDDVFGALEIQLTADERQELDTVSLWDTPGSYL